MEPTAFAKQFPKLYHVTFAGNLPSIERHGLHSSSSLANLYQFSPEEREACLHQRRRCNQDLHGITLRDQGPAHESRMKTCLVKITVPEWFALLNSKIFFFLSESKAQRFLETYSAFSNLLLTVDTAALLTSHAANATLCRINSGSFIHNPRPRGRDSFIPLTDFVYRTKRDTPAELTLNVPVPDVLAFSTAEAVPA